jgi:hypothetical protein
LYLQRSRVLPIFRRRQASQQAFTSNLSIMLGTQKNRRAIDIAAGQSFKRRAKSIIKRYDSMVPRFVPDANKKNASK